jgi:hypothetical protein
MVPGTKLAAVDKGTVVGNNIGCHRAYLAAYEVHSLLKGLERLTP